jgi:hypothetical protein
MVVCSFHAERILLIYHDNLKEPGSTWSSGYKLDDKDQLAAAPRDLVILIITP